MTDYAADCLSHERHDSVICLIVAILLAVSEFRTVETIQTLYLLFFLKRKKKFFLNFIKISKTINLSYNYEKKICFVKIDLYYFHDLNLKSLLFNF